MVRAPASHPDSIPGPGGICGLSLFSSLLREVFLRVLEFSHHLKNQHLQIPIRSGLLSALCQEPRARVITQALPVFDIKFAFSFFFLHFFVFPRIGQQQQQNIEVMVT